MAPAALAAVLITGALATAGVNAIAEDQKAREAVFASDARLSGEIRHSDDDFEISGSDRAHEFGLDVPGPGARQRFGVRIDEDAPSVAVEAGSAGRGFFQVRRGDDEDSDGDSGGDSDSDSERRHGRIGPRDRDRDDRRPGRRDSGVGGIAFDNGFNDGYDRGLEDGRDRNRYDPVRHRDYRSADRGYEGRLGSREQYRIAYRDGFQDGYDRGYQDGEASERTGRIRWPWPF